MLRPFAPIPLFLVLASPAAAAATSAETAAHVDIAPILLALLLMLVGARLGGAFFERLGQSPVLGELCAGILLGNLGLVGFHHLDWIRTAPAIDILAEIGVIFLLFEVGLESDVEKMRSVGASSLLVATLGVVAPSLLGWGVAKLFFPWENELVHAFVGATLCATSVGITARVLSDLKRVTSLEGQIILGAAVIDDVMGLVVLAIVAGIIGAVNRGVPFSALSATWIMVKALLFLVGAFWIGRALSPRAFAVASRLRGEGLLLTTALLFCFGLAYLAAAIGLAPIVGAFAAGLILEPVHYREFTDRGEHRLEELMRPIATLLVPVFFVLMGMRVDLAVFGHAGTLGFAAVLTVAAILGKQACSLGVLEKGVDRLAVGLGMIPRGEVGLIFAGIGATLVVRGQRVISDVAFSAVVVMVAVTTLVTPPLLVWRLRQVAGRGEGKKP
jgi:Kef-type K+ transport system membrane component KefB